MQTNKASWKEYIRIMKSGPSVAIVEWKVSLGTCSTVTEVH